MKPQQTKEWYDPGDLRARDWNDRVPPPRDPILLAHRDGRQPVNQATGRKLFPQNRMPCGKHMGKLMERVPKQYLLDAARQYETDPSKLPGLRSNWHEVHDYVQRFHHDLTQP